MYCSKLFEGLDTRLDQKKSIDIIGEELCSDVNRPREKIINLIKSHKGAQYIFDNADWLGYNVNYIRNPTGNTNTNTINKSLNKITLHTRKPDIKEYNEWLESLEDVYARLTIMEDQFKGTTEGKHILKIRGALKTIKRMRMILRNCKPE